jgi:hypothetical protein
MVVEKGDYFVITRGIELNMDAFGMFGQEPRREPTRPFYDRSWNGVVFRADDVADCVVVAEIVAMNPEMRTQWRKVGMTHMVNLSEVEAMVVSPTFANRMIEQEQLVEKQS